MAECIEVVKTALQDAVAKYGRSFLEKQWFDIRKTLIREYRVSDNCANKQVISQVSSLLRLDNGGNPNNNRIITVAISLPRKSFTTPGGGMYPEYSIVEAIFIGLYHEDPISAHEKIYWILEPVLLSEDGDKDAVKKILFIPINDDTWDRFRISEKLVRFLEMLDSNRRREVCKALSHTFTFLVMGMTFNVTKDRNVWYINIDANLFTLCPELEFLLRTR